MRVILRVQLGELLLRNSEIEQLELVQTLGEHTRLHVSFVRDNETDVHLESLLGAAARLVLRAENDAPSEDIDAFQGVVSGGTQSHYMHSGSRFAIEAISPSVRLEFQNTTYIPQSTLGDVARTLGAEVVGTARSRVPLDLVQLGESDFDFLKRLADENGLFLRTVSPRVELRDSFEETEVELHWGDDLLSVTAQATPVNHGYKGALYFMEEKRDHRFHGVRKEPARLGGAAKLVTAVQALAAKTNGGGDPLAEESAFRTPTLVEFKRSMERESERALGGSVIVHGESTQVRLRAGDAVTLTATSTFKPPTLGALGLVQVIHRFDGQTYSNSFAATTWANFTNYVRPSRRLMPGPVTAEVVTIDDPKKIGRIQVRYRWQELDQQTRWLRVLTLYSGNGRGVHFTPEVGDEVLVAFEQGDPERPYVLGALWNGKDLAPQERGMKRIITKSGNTIQLADEPSGKEFIEIFSPEGLCYIQLSNDAGGLVTIHSEGDLALEAKGEVRITSQSFVLATKGDSFHDVGGKATHDAKGEVIVKSGANVAVQGGQNATLKGGMNVNVVAGMLSNVVGSLVHIQPPGFVAPPIVVTKPREKKSVWAKKKTPKNAKGKSTSDTRTPRST